MNEYKIFYQELERQGFELIESNIGKRNFVHPKNKKYMVSFDYDKLKIHHNDNQIYETYEVSEQLIIIVIQHIKDFKSSKNQLIESLS